MQVCLEVWLWTPDGSKLYSSTDNSPNNLLYVDLPVSMVSFSSFNAGNSPYGIVFESNSKGYVALSGDNAVRQINSSKYTGCYYCCRCKPKVNSYCLLQIFQLLLEDVGS